MELTCHCRALRLVLPAPPETVTLCNCSICRRYGVLWGYFSPRVVDIHATDEATDVYMWDDRSIRFCRCGECGCVTHWLPNDPDVDRMGVNMRMADPNVLAGIAVRKLDGAVTERYVE